MKRIQILFFLLAFGLFGYSSGLRAEDIDIYVSNSSNVGVPNVLFVIDNGADFSANANVGCSSYAGITPVTAPSTGTSTTAGVLQCSLVAALSGLAGSAVNIGIMVSNANSFAETQTTTDTTKGGYHELCANGGNGGCLLRKLALMDTTNKANLIKFIKGWQVSNSNGGNTVDQFLIKVNSSLQASTMQEAWAYFNGRTGLSGKSYSPSVIANGCQRNFIIYISNTQKNPSSSESGTASAALTSAGGSTSNPITGAIKFTTGICPTNQIPGGSTSYTLLSGNNWADEWARFMYQTDAGASGNEGIQNVVTYTIGVQSSGNQCSNDTYGLIASMAKNGGGKFFNTASVDDLTAALNSILNEVQAVNSVFSSASLPVSVNAQGTYLNQIYLGMFRPDSTGSPRWLGNLKQYKLVKDPTGSLVLGDAKGNSAISASGTGFISPTAESYWTYKDTTAAPDNITVGSYSGMFANNPEGTPINGYDLPDGEVVEKGGTAQQMRKENLAATFSGARTSGTNPRRLYTYCPSDTGCVADLTDTSNDFSTSNSGIAASTFGTTTLVKVTNISRTGSVGTVTTLSDHGFTTNTQVTLADTSYYDGTYTITVTGSKTFTFPTDDFPNATSLNSYQVSTVTGSPVSITSIARTPSSTSTADSETVTVTTSSAHGFTTASNIQVSGASPSNYLFSGNPLTASGSTLTYNVAISPPATATNTYTAAFNRSVSATLNTNTVGGWLTASSFTGDINLRVGQVITITGAGNNKYNGTFTVQSATYTAGTNTTAFTASGGGASLKSQSQTTGTLTLSTTAKAITALTRVGTTDTSSATATGLPSNWFGTAANQTAVVNIAKASGTSTTESAYVKIAVTATCQNAGCTTITFPISVTPTSTVTLTSATVGPPGGASFTILAGKITRSGATATVNLNSSTPAATATSFTSGQQVLIAQTGTKVSDNEGAYEGTKTITCSAGNCLTFTISPVTLTPVTPATAGSMTAYSSSTPPDKDTIIKWVRGLDNYGDELGPGGTVTTRPSIHGDVLHSRPLVVNYGDSRGIAVFYGSNDGVYHAVNGNQSAAIGSVPAGGELWGFIIPEHFGYLNRQRIATPELKFPSTTLSTATAKDYFIDGPTGAYQKLKADGSIDIAYIFLTMRRGGRFIYGLDVTTPTVPKLQWKLDSSSTGFTELGQSWSRPRLTLLQSSAYQTTPVVVFAAGYDTTEDSEPPGTDSMGRGIYIVNAATGGLIWSSTPGCTTSVTCLQNTGLTHAIPSEVTFVDRDNDGYTDKIYVGDLGGNVWRIDVADADRLNWKMTKVAALGCDAGTCASGTTPRKFFFPPAVLSVKAPGATGSYDVLTIVSGDREHPLKNTATGSSYNVADKVFVIKDLTTTVNPSTFLTTNLDLGTNLNNATSTAWDGTKNGFYINFATGEKGVNAPLALNGNVFFSTNQPSDPSATCAANLGTARAYAVSPFTSEIASNTLAGGGLPPSPVAGLVEVSTTVGNTTTTTEEKFCIGCGLATPPGTNNTGPTTCTGNAALQNCTPLTNVTGSIKRTYWYKK